MAIPRTIVQSHESEYTFPAKFARCRTQLHAVQKDFEYLFFSARARRQFIEQRRPDLLALYDFYPLKVQKADLFRVVAIHELGGFYLDLDIHLHERIDDLCSSSLVLAEEWQMTPETYERRHHIPPVSKADLVQIGNYGFGATAGHWFLKELIEEMLRRAETISVVSHSPEDIYFSTGPDVLSAVYCRYRDALAGEVTVLQGPEEERWCQFGKYGTHLMTGSWA